MKMKFITTTKKIILPMTMILKSYTSTSTFSMNFVKINPESVGKYSFTLNVEI